MAPGRVWSRSPRFRRPLPCTALATWPTGASPSPCPAADVLTELSGNALGMTVIPASEDESSQTRSHRSEGVSSMNERALGVARAHTSASMATEICPKGKRSPEAGTVRARHRILLPSGHRPKTQ